MPEIAPFKGIRYDAEKVGDILDVVAPPYDVISSAEQEALYARHPNNCVRIILAKEKPGDTETDNRYTRAAAAFREWLDAGILKEDATPAMYPYEQQFTPRRGSPNGAARLPPGGSLNSRGSAEYAVRSTWEGQHYARRGVLTALKVVPFGQGDVLPHEFTKPGAKADRLALMKATGANTSPIFGIFPDEEHDVAAALEAVWTAPPVVDITDADQVRHRMWVLTDADIITRIQALMRTRPVYIADGHHRYETTCNYAAWAEEQGRTSGDLHRYCIMMLVAMSDPGLVVMPTHRLLNGLGDLAADDLVAALADAFDVAELEGAERTPGAMERALAENARRHAFGLVAEGGRRAWLLTLRDERVLDGRPGDASPDWRRLDVAILADLIIEDTIRRRLGREVEIGYDHQAESSWRAVAEGACQMAFLLNPTPVERVKVIAAGGERMPAKSTFFYPKLLSGLVFRRLR